MTFKTMLAIHSTDEPLGSLAPVVALAHTYEAHVDVLIISALVAMPPIIAMEVPSKVWSEAVTNLTKRCEERSEAVKSYFAEQGVGVSVTVKAQQTALIDNAIANSAIYCDLVVMQRNESLVSGVAGHALQGALFDAGKPVLVLDQETKAANDKPEHVFIAWDGSREAARAVQHSLPILQKATRVTAFSIASGDDAEVEQGMEDLKRVLSRNDVKLNTLLVPLEGQITAKALLRYINEQRPTLLVMGGYGHSRLREFVFSGITRAVLTHDIDTTLLLSH